MSEKLAEWLAQRDFGSCPCEAGEAQAGGEGGVRLLAAALLLSACASNGTGRYLLVTDTSHGTITWSRFDSREACEQGKREDDQARLQSGLTPDTRCTTGRDLRRRR